MTGQVRHKWCSRGDLYQLDVTSNSACSLVYLSVSQTLLIISDMRPLFSTDFCTLLFSVFYAITFNQVAMDIWSASKHNYTEAQLEEAKYDDAAHRIFPLLKDFEKVPNV